MSAPNGGCPENSDPLQLTRQGTRQQDRGLDAHAPDQVPVDGRRSEHAMVFAANYAKHLRFFGLDDIDEGDWQGFFTSDVSAQLAIVAIEDVGTYRKTLAELLRGLADPPLSASAPTMVAALTAVFDCVGTLARQLDTLLTDLPVEQPLRAALRNLIRGQLSPMLRRLVGYYEAGRHLGTIDSDALPPEDVLVLGRPAQSFALLLTAGLSAPEWPGGFGAASWEDFVTVDVTEYTSAYGPGPVEDQVNHLATHHLFTAAHEAFLAAFARVVQDAGNALRATFDYDGHQPHYALFLAFLRLLEHTRAETNRLTSEHLMFYYRRVLRFEERPARPDRAHLLVELAKHVDQHLLPAGTLLRAGKDETGADAHFVLDRDLAANRATLAELKSLYRHPVDAPLPPERGRIFATPKSDEGDSWHPFVEKAYVDGVLARIDTPRAELGFAIASHHLWMAEGERAVTVHLGTGTSLDPAGTPPVHLLSRLTAADGWVDQTVTLQPGENGLTMDLTLDGGDPPITPYDPAVHGYAFGTPFPVLLVLLDRDDATPPAAVPDYPRLCDITVTGITLSVEVDGVKTLELSNDHGRIDGSKPFLAFGSVPTAGSSLTIGSREVFRKSPRTVTVHTPWMATPVPHETDPAVRAQALVGGAWQTLGNEGYDVETTEYVFDDVPAAAAGTPDLTAAEPYSTASRTGYIRLRLTDGFGTQTYPIALAQWIAQGSKDSRPSPPVLPMLDALTVDYTADVSVDLASSTETDVQYFHVTPFGHVEVSLPGARTIPLLPQFRTRSQPAEGMLHLGVGGLRPPQNLSLLFQVVEGSADPRVVKPADHLEWSYLHGNDWVPFARDAVDDGTAGLLASGVISLAIPGDATTGHTLMPGGLHWIRLSVATAPDAVCRLVGVAAQAARSTYAVPPSSAMSHGPITKLDVPHTAVKGISQPFPAFGGSPRETEAAFATRVSERLRHKDRAIALWDYEHLVLEEFPEIYQARCLNHTRYEPSPDGAGVYRELAPGHVTVVTIPDLAGPDPRDPMRPFTSLRVLGQIERFLAARMSCFARLHVRNPQFEEVRVELRVRFHDGADETFHTRRLREEISQFLAPWAFRGDARPSFNGTVHPSAVVDFVEERPYVDCVSDVRLFHRIPGVTDYVACPEGVTGSRAISILVSAPPVDHQVTAIHADDVLDPDPCGCGQAVPR
jgi:hypothetical protein